MKNIKRGMHLLLLLFILCFSILVPCYAADGDALITGNEVSLTEEEKEYIKNNPTISMAVDTSWVPYEFAQKDGSSGGIIPNIMQLVADRVGLNVKFMEKNTYADAIAACRSGETMLVSGIANDPKMAENNDVHITNPYITIRYSAVTKMDVENLYVEGADYRAAICVGSYVKMAMEAKMPSYQFVEYTSNKECLDALINNEADIALLADYSAGYYTNFHEYSHLFTVPINDFYWGLCFGVNKDIDPMLIGILNKGIASITDNDLNQAIYAGATEATTTGTKFSDIIYDNPIAFAVMAGAMSALLVFSIFLLLLRKKSRIALAKEKELRKQAEAANESKTAFLSCVSHDMRTPMNGILGIADLSMDETDVTILKENILKMKESGNYLLGLINDTLDTQRIQSGKLVLNMDIVDSRVIVTEINNMVAEAAKNKGVHFSFKMNSEDHDRYIRADKMRLKQIFVNLLTNAIKFTPAGGSVQWTIELYSRTKNISHNIFTISDTGIGMSEAFIKEKLYEPFSQEYNTATSQYAGSGLGLLIVKSLVDLMGGRIEVESEKGEGTTFTIYLDFEKVEDAQAEKELRDHSDKIQMGTTELKNKKILLVEDHPLNAEIAQRLLTKYGCIVIWVDNGQKALESFVASTVCEYDAILMDIRMPVMDGLEATKQIRKLDRTDAKTIPIIAMTANAFESDKEHAKKVGITDYMAKPIEPKKLYQTLVNDIK